MNTVFLKRSLVNEKYLRDFIFFDEINSTNNYSKENNIESDILVLTSHQTSGKGRLERTWKSQKEKDITMSIVKSFDLPLSDLHLVNFYSSFVILNVLRNYDDEKRELFYLKWPNDVLLNQKKVSGILIDIIESNENYTKVAIGIGINVNCRVFDDGLFKKATSLSLELDKEFILEELICDIIEYFYNNIDLIKNKNKLMSLWKNETQMIGKQALIKVFEDSKEIYCKILDIENDGGIKVEIENENKFKYFSGDITVLESY